MIPTYFFHFNTYGLNIGVQGMDYNINILITQEELKHNTSTKSLLLLLMGKIQTQLLSIDDKESLGGG